MLFRIYMKNFQIKNWICFVAFFLINSFVPFVLMLMMHRFGPFRERGEREREPVKVTREWRKKRKNFMAYVLAFGLFCFHVAFIHIKMGENWRITNGRGARPTLRKS